MDLEILVQSFPETQGALYDWMNGREKYDFIIISSGLIIYKR